MAGPSGVALAILSPWGSLLAVRDTGNSDGLSGSQEAEFVVAN